MERLHEYQWGLPPNYLLSHLSCFYLQFPRYQWAISRHVDLPTCSNPTEPTNRRLVVDHRLRRHCRSSLRRSRRRCGRSSRCSPPRKMLLLPFPRCLFGYFWWKMLVGVIIVYIIHNYRYMMIYVYIQRCTEMHMNADEWKVKRGKICGMCAVANGMLNVSSQVSVPVAWQGKAWWFFDNTLYIQVFCFQFMTTRFHIHPSKTKHKVLRTCVCIYIYI